MHINQIRLKNFRGYYSLLLNFSSGINVFVGKNASGKTNLLEAIHFLSFAKSFRGVEDKELIKKDAVSAIINASIIENNIKTNIDVQIEEKGKKILINNKAISKLSELNKIANVIVFEPKDVNIFKDSPRVRRNYLDINISKLNDIYSKVISKVDLLLKERNELLKNNNIDQTQLDILTEQLIIEQEQVIIMRQQFVEKINQIISKVVMQIKGKKEMVKLIYFPYIKLNNYLDNARKLYQDNLENDLKRKVTNIGVHREDFILTLNGENIAIQGSQGENRLMAIALKLSPYFLVENKSKHPIIALDDVMSELDNNHQRKLIEFLEKLDQVFITSTNIKINNANVYEINNHQIIRRTK